VVARAAGIGSGARYPLAKRPVGFGGFEGVLLGVGGLPADGDELAGVIFERDAFPFQEFPLDEDAVAVAADPALRVDDPLPGDVRGAGLERVADGARGTGCAEDGGDLAVGHHAARGNVADDTVDGVVEIGHGPSVA